MTRCPLHIVGVHGHTLRAPAQLEGSQMVRRCRGALTACRARCRSSAWPAAVRDNDGQEGPAMPQPHEFGLGGEG